LTGIGIGVCRPTSCLLGTQAHAFQHRPIDHTAPSTAGVGASHTPTSPFVLSIVVPGNYSSKINHCKNIALISILLSYIILCFNFNPPLLGFSYSFLVIYIKNIFFCDISKKKRFFIFIFFLLLILIIHRLDREYHYQPSADWYR
jgi:hypothetical protein